jgi:RNA polymerase sigma-70 factor (ECF subfamily)
MSTKSPEAIEETSLEGRSLEAAIRRACAAGDPSRAAELVIEGYGSEILGYLCARVGDEATARDVFSDFSVELWRGLSKFEWRCSARAWAYTLARNAAVSHHRRERRHVAKRVGASELDRVPWAPATRTPTFLRTPMVNRVRQLREQLAPEERELLSLRIDRGMSFPELAVVLSGSELKGPAQIRREAARWRQRFVAAKRRLEKLARKEGLLS